MLIDTAPPQTLGVSDDPTLRFGDGPAASHGGPGDRLLFLREEPAFELSFWTGTCQALFKRLHGANERHFLPAFARSLKIGLDHVDDDVVTASGALLPRGSYLPTLTQIHPRLIEPRRGGDYFSEEQVATWGLSSFWGLPENPQTPYYRTWETAVDADQHLFEFVVPMVPPAWNDDDTVRAYVDQLDESESPTAVAVSVLDVCSPATDQAGATDHYTHWALVHFLLDGHHKMQAAAQSGGSLRLLSLVSLADGLSTVDQVGRLAELRSRDEQRRSDGAASSAS